MDASLHYINHTYGIEAKVGSRVVYTGGETPKNGTVVGADQQYLKIKMDGEKQAGIYHPTWELLVLK